MEFRKYEKIHRLGKEEVEGILTGLCYVQEKVDGANTSIWKDETGWIRCGSRSKEVKEGFNGFVDYVHTHPGIKKMLDDHPTWTLYGEWLVRHTISYKETSYQKFYLFDIWDGIEYLNTLTVDELAKHYEIEHPQLFGTFVNLTPEQLDKFVGVSNLGDKGEGIVIKNPEFVNKFGVPAYAKIVTQNFKEDNALVFGGNNKHSDTYWEMYIVNKYMTLGRVKKVMNKIQPEIDHKLDMADIPRVMGTAWHDLITEEIFEISKKVPQLDFKKLKELCNRKAKQIFIDIINDNISVADQDEANNA